MQLLAELQNEYPKLHVWDPLPLLCPYSACSAYDRDGKPLYNDSDHLSGHGNRVLESSLSETLLDIWRSTPVARGLAPDSVGLPRRDA